MHQLSTYYAAPSEPDFKKLRFFCLWLKSLWGKCDCTVCLSALPRWTSWSRRRRRRVQELTKLTGSFQRLSSFLRFSPGNTGATRMLLGGEFRRAIIHNPGLKHGGVADETHRLISTPAFLLSLQGIQLPAKSSALSSLPANHAESYYDRGLPLLRFLALVTQQGRNSEERGEEKASLSRSCCFHLSPPAPQFPLTLHHQHHHHRTISPTFS